MSKKKKNTSKPSGMTITEREADAKSAAKKKLKIIVGACIAGVVVIVAFVMLGMAGTGLYAAHTNACSVGDTEVSTSMYDYYYETSYYALVQMYGDDLGDTFGDESLFGDDWRDVVKAYADADIQQDYILYNEAVNAGASLSEEGQAEVEEKVQTMIDTASENGWDDVNVYLEGAVGVGCNIDNYREYLEISTLADEYYDTYLSGIEISADAVKEAYEADPDNYDMYTFYSYYIAGISKEDAEAIAAKISDIDSFDNAITAYLGDDADTDEIPSESSYHENMRVSYINTGIMDWINSGNRSEGDVAAIAYNDSGYFIVYYVDKNSDQSATDELVESDLRNDAAADWLSTLKEANPLTHHWIGMQGVGAKNQTSAS